MKWKAIFSAALLTLATAVPASADPIGQLNLDGGVQQVVVGLTTIDWQPVGGGTGTFVVAGGTTLSYAGGGIVTPGDPGVIRDVPPFPSIGFMTFPLDPALHFDLFQFGPGTSTNCAAASATAGGTCSVYLGSPIILQYNGINPFTGLPSTSVSLAAGGLAFDAVGSSNWSGVFTAQIPNLSPLQIQQLFGCLPGDTAAQCDNQGANITNAYSGSFVLTTQPVPEPASLALLGSGLLGLGMRYRRRRRA